MIKQRWVIAKTFVVLSMLFLCQAAIGAELSFLGKNPALKAKLLQWEREAPKEVKGNIKELRTRDAVTKGYAADRLGKMGPQAQGAILALIETLIDHRGLQWQRNFSVSYTSPALEAAQALGMIGKPAFEPILAALQDKSPRVREGAAMVLGLIKDHRAVDPLITALLKDDDSDVRSAAAVALASIKDPRAVEPLIAALKDKNVLVRRYAEEALDKIDANWVQNQVAKDAVPQLIGDLCKRSNIQNQAKATLSKIDPNWAQSQAAKDAVTHFIAALQYKRSYDRDRAVMVEALGKIKDPRAVEPLKAALQDKDSRVREAAEKALKEIGEVN